MILYEGIHKFRRDKELLRPIVIDYASVSALSPSELKVFVGDKLVEHVYVGIYSPHTWWGNNSLFGRNEPLPGEEFTVIVGKSAIFRIEGEWFEKVG